MEEWMIRTLGTITVTLLMSFCWPSYSQTVNITIDKIDENKLISGHVNGLDEDATKKFRVVVYIHTDIWYIHPYAGQGEGKTCSSITNDGKWAVETVRRSFPADEIGALVVRQDYQIPAKTETLESVQNIGITRERLSGTPDFGKL
jgi:hypothetical protein